MKRQTLLYSVVLAILSSFASTDSCSAASLYREDFTSDGDSALADHGWDGSEIGVNGNSAGVYGDPGGVPQDGFHWWYNNTSMATNTPTTELSYTTELSPISSATNNLAISWESRLEHQFDDSFVDMSGTGTGVGMRVALQLGGQWYVSNSSISSGNIISGDWTLNTVPFDPAAANWRLLDNVDGSPGVTFGVAAGADLTGDITGVGLVSTFAQYQTLNINYLEITGVPEPATFALAVCGVVGTLLRSRKRLVV